MQLLYIGLMWCILAIVSCSDRKASFTHQCEVYQLGYAPFLIDVPEEWSEIKRDSTKPDTLIAYKDSKEVVHIVFANKRNQ